MLAMAWSRIMALWSGMSAGVTPHAALKPAAIRRSWSSIWPEINKVGMWYRQACCMIMAGSLPMSIWLSFACDDKVGIGNDVVEIEQL